MDSLWAWLIVSIIVVVFGLFVMLTAGTAAVLHGEHETGDHDPRKVGLGILGALLAGAGALSLVASIVFLIIAGIRAGTGT